MSQPEQRRREDLTMAEVMAELRSIRESLAARDNTDTERRGVDDRREQKAQQDRADLLARVDKHGIRTTALETKWESFFGDQGAFKGFIARLEKHDQKLDRLLWLGGLGTGILICIQFFVKR